MSRGRGNFSSRGRGVFGGRGGYNQRDAGPPDTVLEMGSFVHAVEDEMLCVSSMKDRVPYFNAPIYLQNKSEIGKVDEILGPINEVFFSVKMGDGMIAGSFKKGDKVFISGEKLLPIERFLPKPKLPKGVQKRGRGRGSSMGAGASFRGRGGFQRGGAGGSRGRGFGGRGSGRGFSSSRVAPASRGGFRGRGRGRGGA